MAEKNIQVTKKMKWGISVLTEKKLESKKSSLNDNFVSQFKRMLADEIFSDFEVKTANRTVLGVRSPYFFGMLNTDMTESRNNMVEVSENTEIMREVLRFIYCNEVENLSVIALELIEAAEKYQLDDLKKLCIDSIIESLDTDNVLQVLLIADRLSDTQMLKEKCFDYIASNMRSIKKDAPEWKEMSQSLYLDLLFSKYKDNIFVERIF